MSDLPLLAERLRAQQDLYHQLLSLVEQENHALRGTGYDDSFCQRRQRILPELNRLLEQLRADRAQWVGLSVEERRSRPEIAQLLRQAQDLIMKIIVLDRENEQSLLRRGLLPANRLPAAERQQPHYVAQLYRRNHAG